MEESDDAAQLVEKIATMEADAMILLIASMYCPKLSFAGKDASIGK